MLEPCKILIANSDKSEIARLEKAFRQNGWDPIMAGDAAVTQFIAKKQLPRAIVLSSSLPGVKAAVAVEKLRSTVHTIVTPVVIISTPGNGTREEFISAGANEYFERPFDETTVCEVIRKYLETEAPLTLAPVEKIVAPERLAALTASKILDTPPNKQLDFMVRVASLILRVPMTVLSIVDRHRQFFKSQIGTPQPWFSVRETPLSHSFCQWVVAGSEDLIVEDARNHPGLQGNLAIRDLGIVAYAGSPVFSQQGPVLGSFCAIDSQPRKWTPADLDILHCFARMSEAFLIAEKAGDPDWSIKVNACSTIAFYGTRILRLKELANRPFERELVLEIVEQQTNHLRAYSDVRQSVERVSIQH
jgi:CheY-like chemotaxis protein